MARRARGKLGNWPMSAFCVPWRPSARSVTPDSRAAAALLVWSRAGAAGDAEEPARNTISVRAAAITGGGQCGRASWWDRPDPLPRSACRHGHYACCGGR